MVCVSEVMVLVVVCACAEGTVSSDTNCTVLVAPAAAPLSWQPLCLWATKASRLLNCCLQRPQMWMSGVSSTSTVVPPGTGSTAARPAAQAELTAADSARPERAATRPEHRHRRGARGAEPRDAVSGSHGGASRCRPRGAAGVRPGPAARSRPARRSRRSRRPAARSAHPDSRVPPQPGSRAPLPPVSCATQVSGPARTHAPVGFRRAGPGARIPAGAQRHLHCTGPGKAGAAPPPPGFMAGESPARRLRRPRGAPCRQGARTPRLRAAERGRMWRSRACSVAAAGPRLHSVPAAAARPARGAGSRAGAAHVVRWYRGMAVPSARYPAAFGPRVWERCGGAARARPLRTSFPADPFPSSLAVLRTRSDGFPSLCCGAHSRPRDSAASSAVLRAASCGVPSRVLGATRLLSRVSLPERRLRFLHSPSYRLMVLHKPWPVLQSCSPPISNIHLYICCICTAKEESDPCWSHWKEKPLGGFLDFQNQNPPFLNW